MNFIGCIPFVSLARVPMVVAIVLPLGLFANLSNAQESIKTCVALDVRAIEVLAESGGQSPFQSKSESVFLPPGPVPAIDIVPAQRGKENTTSDVMMIVRGPVLGSMDSQKVETNLLCTAKGVLLTATITRSADYNGAVLKNAPWRPQVDIR